MHSTDSTTYSSVSESHPTRFSDRSETPSLHLTFTSRAVAIEDTPLREPRHADSRRDAAAVGRDVLHIVSTRTDGVVQQLTRVGSIPVTTTHEPSLSDDEVGRG